MHEISIIQQVIQTLQAEEKEKFDQIKTIYMQVGELSNVQPILLQSAFEAVQKAESILPLCKIEVEQIPITILCIHCNKISNVKQYKFKCTFCDLPSANIQTGEELLIQKIDY